MQTRLIKLLLTALVVAGGIGFIVYSSIGSTQYYKMVHEFMEAPDEWTGKNISLHGYVEAGSIVENIEGNLLKRHFVLENSGQSIVVRHDGPVPDTFKDKSEVVAKGRVIKTADGSYELMSEQIMAKCPSKYEGLPEDEHLKRGTKKRVF